MNSEDEHDRLDLQFDPMDDQGLMPPYHHGHQIIHPAHYSEMHDPSMRQHLPPHNEMQHPHHHHHQHAHPHPHPHHHHRMAAQQQAQENMQLQQQQRHDQNSKNNVPPDHEDSNAEKEEEQVVEAGHTEVTDSSQNDTPNGDSNPDQSSNAGINDAKVKVSDETTKKIAPGRTETRLKASPIKRFDTKVEIEPTDTNIKAQQSFIQENNPTSDLEKALSAELGRKNSQIEKLKSEVIKLKQFISKRKQTYKRKRKEDGAPTRALSAYNIFVQERFEELAKENEQALMNADKDAPMKRVLPSNLVAKTGHEWRALPEEKKKVYRERAKADKKRYNDAMSKYHPPEKQVNKKRNKTGYNMFFSSHVNELKQNDGGVPSERGSVARLVGNAWKVRFVIKCHTFVPIIPVYCRSYQFYFVIYQIQSQPFVIRRFQQTRNNFMSSKLITLTTIIFWTTKMSRNLKPRKRRKMSTIQTLVMLLWIQIACHMPQWSTNQISTIQEHHTPHLRHLVITLRIHTLTIIIPRCPRLQDKARVKGGTHISLILLTTTRPHHMLSILTTNIHLMICNVNTKHVVEYLVTATQKNCSKNSTQNNSNIRLAGMASF